MTALATTALRADVLSVPHEPTGRRPLAALGRWVVGFAEIVLMLLVVPLGILLVGLPVAIVVRVIIELASLL